MVVAITIIGFCVVVFLIILYAIKFESVEIDPESPFYQDEIEHEGWKKFKLKSNRQPNGKQVSNDNNNTIRSVSG